MTIVQRFYFRPEDKMTLLSLVGPDFDFEDILPLPNTSDDTPDWKTAQDTWGSQGSPSQVHWGTHYVEVTTPWGAAEGIALALSHHLPLGLEWIEDEVDHLGGVSLYKDGHQFHEERYFLPIGDSLTPKASLEDLEGGR